MNDVSLSPLWANCIELLKDRVNNRSFWEALEKTQAITIEGGILIIGLDSVNFNRASHILQIAHFNAVLKAVAELFQQPLQVRIIEGSTLADWASTQDHDARVLAMKQAAVARRTAVEPPAGSHLSQMAKTRISTGPITKLGKALPILPISMTP